MGQAVRQQALHQVQELGPVLGGEAAEGGLAELLGQGLDVGRMAVAEAADGDAGDEVQVLGPVGVDDGAAVGVVDGDLGIEGDGLQAGGHGLGLLVEDRLGARAGDRAGVADAGDRARGPLGQDGVGQGYSSLDMRTPGRRCSKRSVR